MPPAESSPQRPQEGQPSIVFNEKLPHAPLRMNKAVSAAVSPSSPLGQEFRILAAKMRSMGESKGRRVFGVVSATGGEGKTTIAIGLAAAMADPGRRVLLMECDLRKPAIDKYLGLDRV